MEQPVEREIPGIRSWLVLALAWEMAFSVSCLLTSTAGDIQSRDNRDSVTGVFLGESRLALSGHFYELAETYFHGGWEHSKQEAFQDSIFQEAASEISPRHHIHVEGAEVREIMPWLRLATIMNPSDVRIYLDSAFWLGYEAGRPDLAEQVLLEAQVNNPYNYQVQLERGRLFLKEKRIADAKQAFDAGLAFWPGKEKTDTFDTKDGKARLLLYRALLYEADQKRPEAISCLKEIMDLFPERTAVGERIRTLEEGKEPSLLASRALGDMLKNDADTKNEDQCKHRGEQ